MADKTPISDKAQVSSLINGLDFTASLTEHQTLLNTIEAEISSYENKLVDLKKQRDVIIANLKDVDAANALLKRIRLREGVK